MHLIYILVITDPSVQLHTPLAPSTVKRESVAQDPLAMTPRMEIQDTNVDDVVPTASSVAPPPFMSLFGTVDNMTEDFQSECSRRPVDASNVPKNLIGMKTLAKNNMWRAILETSAMFPFDAACLTNSRPIDEDVQQILSLRFEALFRLKMFDELSSEAVKIMSQLALLEDDHDATASRL